MAREEWFMAGVDAINALRPGTGTFYVCPCCMTMYDREALNTGDLTIEHVPPKQLGGLPLVLTCRPCNNAAGTRLESDAETREAHIDFARGDSRPIRGVIETGGIELRGNVQASNGGISLVGVPKANHPDRPSEVKSHLDRLVDDGENDWTMRFTSLEPFNPRMADLAWVRAAYLAAFALLGYTYVLWPELELVREQLAHADGDRVNIAVAHEAGSSVERREMWLIHDPEWLASLAVRIGRHTVFLPARTADSGFFARVASGLGAASKVNLDWGATAIPWPSAPIFGMDYS